MATLKDLSRKLGLSVTQVSRALNGHDDVNALTRARVQQAARDLNYHPNISARKLASGRSGIVGLVLADTPARSADGLFVQMIGGLSRYFSERGMQFVLHVAGEGEDLARVHERLINGGSLDGFVLVEPQVDDRRIPYLQKRNVPFVVHGRHRAGPDYPFFDIDNHGVGYRLTEALTKAGHRQIAFLNGKVTHSFAAQRRDGFVQALRDAGIAPAPGLHLGAEMTEGFGLLSTVQLCGPGGARPTAIICGNTLIAKGVFDALAALGLRVPHDISVVAHDDDLPVFSAASIPVPLTVTAAALSESWQQLAELLALRIDGAPLGELQRFGQLSLIERASVAPPPKPL